MPEHCSRAEKKASSTSWLSTGAIALALSKLGIFKLIGKGGKGLMSLFGKGSQSGVPAGAGTPSAYSTDTMYVTAQVVNVYGSSIKAQTQVADFQEEAQKLPCPQRYQEVERPFITTSNANISTTRRSRSRNCRKGHKHNSTGQWIVRSFRWSVNNRTWEQQA